MVPLSRSQFVLLLLVGALALAVPAALSAAGTVLHGDQFILGWSTLAAFVAAEVVSHLGSGAPTG